MQHPANRPAFKRTVLAQTLLATLLSAPFAAAQAQSAATDLGTVQAGGQGGTAKTQSMESKKLQPEHVFKSGQSTKVLGKTELQAAGPVGGSAQALSLAPGVGVTGYGATGSTKNSISVNGLKQGWGGFSNGQIDNGALSVTFDGVPMVNPSTGLWESPQVPQLSLLQGIGITYGPGDPEDRWYNNIGGQIAFVPLQPTPQAGGSIGLSVGSYGARNLSYSLNTGAHDGWSTIIAGGTGSSNSYRTSVDGFDNRSQNYAFFLKTRKQLDQGDMSFGFYQARGTGYRPVMIPVQPIAGVTLDGTANTPLYSQPTSGFYSSIPANVWYKIDTNKTRLIYGKFNIQADSNLAIHNLIWYRLGERVHDHYNNYGMGNPGNLFEHNNPSTSTYGDKLWGDISLPYNVISVGGFFLKSHYNSRNAFYNPNPPYFGSQTVPNAHYRSDYWDQTDLAVFAQDKISPLSNLDITPGIRFINDQTNYYPGAQADFPQAYALYPNNNQGTLPAANVSHHDTEPSISANYRPLDWLALFGNYAVAYKEPQVGGGGGLYQSTPPIYNLEKSQDYNVGFKIHVKNSAYLHNFLLSASYYHLHFSNQYIPLFDSNGNYLGDANGDSVYKGVNISASDDVLYNLNVFANLNIEKADFNNYVTGGVSYNGLPVANVPNRTFNIGATYQYYQSGVLWEPKVWYQYVGAQNMFDNGLGATSNQKIPGYGLLNLGLDGVVPTHQSMVHTVHFSIDVLNATNKQYNPFEFVTGGGWLGGASKGQVLALPGAPRTLYASVTADF
ncbi:TonB-dependent receptor [Thiomonas sp.]|uniref:TonB-dependent receptor n=1 Tax=Thiomonas sp. TaxID=2047785 RepID=UPI0025868E84|nr:TonB-dependent receptor [Thiomonas sp.]